MSQLYLHRLTVKQHSKHWLNFSLFSFFWLIFFCYVRLCFGGIFTQFFCFQFLRVCIQCCQKCFFFHFVSNFGFFDKYLAILAKQVLVALKICFFPSKHKTQTFFFTRRQPLLPVGRQHSSLPIPLLFSVFRLVQHRQLIPAFSCSEFRGALGRWPQRQRNKVQKSPPEYRHGLNPRDQQCTVLIWILEFKISWEN